jgi:hypothetical protein
LFTIVSRILTEDLGKKSVAAKFVPRLLSREQKEFRATVAQDLLFLAKHHITQVCQPPFIPDLAPCDF